MEQWWSLLHLPKRKVPTTKHSLTPMQRQTMKTWLGLDMIYGMPSLGQERRDPERHLPQHHLVMKAPQTTRDVKVLLKPLNRYHEMYEGVLQPITHLVNHPPNAHGYN